MYQKSLMGPKPNTSGALGRASRLVDYSKGKQASLQTLERNALGLKGKAEPRLASTSGTFRNLPRFGWGVLCLFQEECQMFGYTIFFISLPLPRVSDPREYYRSKNHFESLKFSCMLSFLFITNQLEYS